MNKILCYGDSNTFGFNPLNGSRFDQNTRWSGILKQKLASYFILEEGLNNRTCTMENSNGYAFCAYKHLPGLINKIDTLIFATGVNDLQFQYSFDCKNIEKKLKELFLLLKKETKRVIVLSPVELNKTILNGNFKIFFNEKSINNSILLNKIFEKTSKEYNFEYINLNEFILPSEIDGLHYDKNGHKIIADLLIKQLT